MCDAKDGNWPPFNYCKILFHGGKYISLSEGFKVSEQNIKEKIQWYG